MLNQEIVKDSLKRIVNGTMFDTDKCKPLFQIENGSNWNWERITVFQSETNLYFSIRAFWGCGNDYQFKLLTLTEVLNIIGHEGNIELYEQISGVKVKTA